MVAAEMYGGPACFATLSALRQLALIASVRRLALQFMSTSVHQKLAGPAHHLWIAISDVFREETF
jgi:hypothetical protein